MLHAASVRPAERRYRFALSLNAAFTALVIGALVYASRSVPQAALLESLRSRSLAGAFGATAGWLPSALHSFGFGVLTSLCLPARPRFLLAGCGAWGLVNALFEWGQHPQIRGPLAALLRHVPGGSPLADYFWHGVFDGADLAASLAGALAAAALLLITSTTKEPYHAHRV